MDPAGPAFNYGDPANRLSSSDAQFTVVVHTSVVLGTIRPLGMADFYPNGVVQGVKCDELCSHSRAYQYYGAALDSNGIFAKQCADYNDAYFGSCKGPTVVFKGDLTSNQARGIYYFKTNPYCPFWMGKKYVFVWDSLNLS